MTTPTPNILFILIVFSFLSISEIASAQPAYSFSPIADDVAGIPTPQDIYDLLKKVYNAVTNLPTVIYNTLHSTFTDILNRIADIPTVTYNLLYNTLYSIKTALANLPGAIYDKLSSAFDSIKTTLANLPYTLYSSLINMGTAALNALANMMEGGVAWIGSLFGISAPLAAVVFGIILVFGAYLIIKLILDVI